MTSAPSSAPRWPLYLLAAVGLVVLSPFILALLFTGLALTLGLMGKLIKVGAIVFVIWAGVTIFKKLFGGPRSHPLPPPVHMGTALRVSPDSELQREKRESLAALDRELARAMANMPPSEQPKP